MLQQIRHILEYEKPWAMDLQNPLDVAKKIAVFRAVKTRLLAGFGKRLARETGAQDVMTRNMVNANLAYVPRRLDGEVQPVKASQVFVDLAGEYALMS